VQILVLGGGGFIGAHLVKRLKREGHWVRAVDRKFPEFGDTAADDFLQSDLRDPLMPYRGSRLPRVWRLDWLIGRISSDM
jgi:nucleoside-diphosphate-sugar epimerase